MTDDMDKTAIGVMIESTQMLQPAAEATQYAASVDCPVCHTPNPPSETYCIDCGFVLSSEPVAVEEMPAVGSLVTADGTREFALKPGENSVGRQDADVLLAHNTVSRTHAKITVEEGKVFVEDLGSTNGTTITGKKLEAGERVELADGVEIVFGSQALVFKSTDEHGRVRMEGEGEAPAEPQGEGEAPAEPQWKDEAPAEPPARLVSSDNSLSFDLREGVLTIGRRAGNDIVIPDPYCSGSHAEIRVEGGSFTITDVGSTNGTLVNGVKLEANVPKEVRSGDEITLGRTVFKIEAPE